MENFLKKQILPLGAGYFRTKDLINRSKQHIIHVFYHTVSDKYLPHIHPIYTPKKRDEFVRDIEFLTKHFEPVGINRIREHVAGDRKIINPSFHLSFDDGLKEVYTVAAPFLSQKNIPATVFVNTGFIDNKSLFFRSKTALIIDKLRSDHIPGKTLQTIRTILKPFGLNEVDIPGCLLRVNYLQCPVLDIIAGELGIDFSMYLKKKEPYLSTSELTELKAMGFTIGAHSIDHPYYGLLDEPEQIRQTIESCDFIQQHFEEKYRYFSFPFSNEKVKPSFFTSIYPNVDLTFGIYNIRNEYQGRHIHRIDMETGCMYAKNRINMAYLTYLFRSLKK